MYYIPKISISRSMMPPSGPRPFGEVDYFVGPPDNSITITWRFDGVGNQKVCDIVARLKDQRSAFGG